MELAEASGGVLVKAAVLERCGTLSLIEGNLDAAEDAFTEALELYREVGFEAGHRLGAQAPGRTRVEARRPGAGAGTLSRGREDPQEARRPRVPLRGAARLAELLVDDGRIDEAERFALEARETVGPQDALSQITTTFALGVVRAAQGRDEEAEALFLSALERAEAGPFRLIEREAVDRYARFLRERGRDDEAAPLEDRLASGPLAAAA